MAFFGEVLTDERKLVREVCSCEVDCEQESRLAAAVFGCLLRRQGTEVLEATDGEARVRKRWHPSVEDRKEQRARPAAWRARNTSGTRRSIVQGDEAERAHSIDGAHAFGALTKKKECTPQFMENCKVTTSDRSP